MIATGSTATSCGSGGMFVQSEKFVEAHGGRIGDIAIYGQESNPTTRRLAMMNLAIRGIEGDLGAEHADSFRRDLHNDLKADFVLANPPFNDSDWGGEQLRKTPAGSSARRPKGNANFAWVQHFVHHLSPKRLGPGSCWPSCAVYTVKVAFQRHQQLAGRRAPDARGFVPAGSDNALVIRRESCAVYTVRVAFQRHQQLTGPGCLVRISWTKNATWGHRRCGGTPELFGQAKRNLKTSHPPWPTITPTSLTASGARTG